MSQARALIQPPPRSTLPGVILIAAALVLFSAIPFWLRLSPWVPVAAVFLCAAALLLREQEAFSFSLFTALIASAAVLIPLSHAWPYRLLLPILVYFALTAPVRRFRPSLAWLRPGRFGRDLALLIFLTASLSGAALFLWHRLLAPDLAIHLAHIPDMPVWLFPFAGLAFSLGNAAVEEIAFRGIAMHALESAFGPGWAAITLQAWLFGAFHFLRGFPNGYAGLAMAGAYGLMLGIIRSRAQGLAAPWLAHVFADLVIFAILAATVLDG